MSETEPAQPIEMKTCPSCAEPVRAAARMCRYCGYRFQDAATGSPAAAATGQAGAILSTIAGALLILGSLLPWASLRILTHAVHRSGLHWGGGIVTLVLGVVILLAGIAALTGMRLPNLTGVGVLLAGVIAGVVGTWEFARVRTQLGTFRPLPGRFHAPPFLARFASGHVGIGLWAVIAGAVLAIVAGFLMQTAAREERPAYIADGDQPATVSA